MVGRTGTGHRGQGDGRHGSRGFYIFKNRPLETCPLCPPLPPFGSVTRIRDNKSLPWTLRPCPSLPRARTALTSSRCRRSMCSSRWTLLRRCAASARHWPTVPPFAAAFISTFDHLPRRASVTPPTATPGLHASRPPHLTPCCARLALEPKLTAPMSLLRRLITSIAVLVATNMRLPPTLEVMAKLAAIDALAASPAPGSFSCRERTDGVAPLPAAYRLPCGQHLYPSGSDRSGPVLPSLDEPALLQYTVQYVSQVQYVFYTVDVWYECVDAHPC